jgi:Polysaccharide deacetylase
VATKATQLDIVYWYDKIINVLQEKRDYKIDIRDFNNKSYHVKAGKTGEGKWTIIQSLLQDLKKLGVHDREQAVDSIMAQCCSTHVTRKLRHLTVNEIQELARSPLVTIGAHSHCHSMLPAIPGDEAMQSIAESRRLLEEWSSRPVIHFSYPNGDHDEAVLNMVKECGFVSAVTTRSDFWQSTDSLFQIPRLGIGRYDSLDKFKYRTARPTGK